MCILRKALAIFIMSLLMVIGMTVLVAAKDSKMDPNELVTLHLKSIGSPETLKAIKTIINEGNGTVRVLGGGSGMLEGPSVFLSEGPKTRLFMNLGSTTYPAEQFVFDGQNLETGFLTPGKRSRLGVFLYSYPGIVREGLFGGAISTAWVLQAPEKHDIKLQYTGTKKLDGQELHELKCIMKKKEGELNIFFYFEMDTYRHVRTLYEAHVAGALSNALPNSAGQIDNTTDLEGRMARSSQQKENRYILEERFSDFRVVNGLTLPANWRIQFTSDVGARTSIMQWELKFTKTMLNEPINPSVFVMK
jgi:hypothetical protein